MSANRIFECMIAAGGSGSRLGLGMPKCLIEINGKSLLEINIEQCKLSGINNILLLCDAEEWLDKEVSIARQFQNVTVLKDKGYSSTFELCRDYADHMREHFLFLYSHAPRNAAVLKRFLPNPLVEQRCGLVPSSSRRVPIGWNDGFIEPPLLLSRGRVLGSPALNWVRYFDDTRPTFEVIDVHGPGEFNYSRELEEFLLSLDWAA